jgi:hypothetical protein
LKESYLQRSYALKELVALYLANYFGDGVPQGQGTTAVKEARHEDNRKAINKERVRRRDA